MDLYPYLLKAACSVWLKETYPRLHGLAIPKGHHTPAATSEKRTGEELPALEIPVSIGPWVGLYVWFKSPGETLEVDEKEALSMLRNQGYRVAIVRHPQDFKTFVCTLIQPLREVF